jgi:hypothetical protein
MAEATPAAVEAASAAKAKARMAGVDGFQGFDRPNNLLSPKKQKAPVSTLTREAGALLGHPIQIAI